MVAIEQQNEAAALRRVARRVEDIMQDARTRERRGQFMAVDIEAHLRLRDRGAIQFQVATAILEEISGLREDEVVTELLSLGLAAVLESAAEVANATAGLGWPEDARPLMISDEDWPQTLPTRSAGESQAKTVN